MINFIASLLGGKTWLAWLVVAGLGAGAAGGAWAYIDHGGYARAANEWTIKYDKREAELQKARFAELDRQATVNAEAKARETTKLAAEKARADALDALVADLQAAAEADPNHDRIGLGADSVDRLNRIQ